MLEFDIIANWKLAIENFIEHMQAGRASEGFDGGVLSPYWVPLQQHFGRLIYDAIKG